MKSYKPFYNTNIYYNKHVLIPRKETEFIIDEALKIIPSNSPYSILDLGTGSGCIPIAILNMLEKIPNIYTKVNILGVDISKEALNIAKINKEEILKELKNNFELRESNLFNHIQKKEKFNLITANLPYIPSDAIHSLPLSVQEEPHIALDGGKDGLELIYKALNEIKEYSYLNTKIIIECDPWQIELIKDYVNSSNFNIIRDYSGNQRLLVISL